MAWDAMVDRIQALVLGFLLVVWVSLLVILVVAPEVYDQALRLPGGCGAELAFLAALALHRVARGRGWCGAGAGRSG
jgi:hypothetical protein